MSHVGETQPTFQALLGNARCCQSSNGRGPRRWSSIVHSPIFEVALLPLALRDVISVLKPEEVYERYRGMISLGTLRNWRMMKIGPSFLKLGRAVLYPLSELEAWDRKNLVICRAAKVLSRKEREAAV